MARRCPWSPRGNRGADRAVAATRPGLTLPDAVSTLAHRLASAFLRSSTPAPQGRVHPWAWFAAVLWILLLSCPVRGQLVGDELRINATSAWNWTDRDGPVLLLEGNVELAVDGARLRAGRAVLRFSQPRGPRGGHSISCVLLDEARIEHEGIVRSGAALQTELLVRDRVTLTADTRQARDRSDSATFREAVEFVVNRPVAPPRPGRPPASQPVSVRERLDFSFDELQTIQADDGTVAVVLRGKVALLERRSGGELVELRADRAVLFTSLTDLADLADPEQRRLLERSVRSAYLEGDVRVSLAPPDPRLGEQRLEAERVYYDFVTEQAVLTRAILHTIEPTRQVPVTVRAAVIKQLAQGEWTAENAGVSTSKLAVPGYSLRTGRVYVAREDTLDPARGTRTRFDARNALLDLYGVPVFWFPVAAGSVTERGFPLRRLQLENSGDFGFGVRSEWGLLDLLGISGPANLDVGLYLDYLGERGPATGVNARYQGGFIHPASKQPWTFQGGFDSYLVWDEGTDNLGGERGGVAFDGELRGRVSWEHQHFFPGDWQLQSRANWVSDATFLEEWFPREFRNGDPADVSAYLKRQRQSEALTLLVQFQPNGLPTTADQLQEVTPLVDPALGVQGQRPVVVEKLPEIGYRIVGDNLGTGWLTLFSDNTLAGMRFNETRPTLADMGFRNQRFVRKPDGSFAVDPDTGRRLRTPAVLPGYPASAYTGVSEAWVARGDFRQQIDFPLNTGLIRTVPYVVARYTGYSDSPDDAVQNRFLAGAGVRMSTTFWRVDDDVDWRILDVRRMRHVVEPELNLFTSIATEDRGEVFVYEEQVDGVSDISAVQLALLQRWQTKRGGAGRLRSVDVFTLNLRGTLFANAPDEPLIADRDGGLYAPVGFRGLFFPSLPEASTPRNTLSADGAWRISDTTALLSDVAYNFDEGTLATASLGMAAERGDRLKYYLGTRYVGEVNSTLLSFVGSYQLSPKYLVALSQSVELADVSQNTTTLTLVRRFDRFRLTLTAYTDQVDNDSGFSFSLIPEGLGDPLGLNAAVSSFFRNN